MTVRYLADEDLKVGIVQGLRSREPAIDILEIADQQGRILITYDRHTMTPTLVSDRLEAGKSTPGVFILPQQRSAIGDFIE